MDYRAMGCACMGMHNLNYRKNLSNKRHFFFFFKDLSMDIHIKMFSMLAYIFYQFLIEYLNVLP